MNNLVYQSVAWMQRVIDKTSGKEFYTLGPMDNMKDTLAVTPVGGSGETVFFCRRHNFAYGIHEACLDCRSQVRDEPLEGGVTSCDTPEIQRD